MANTSAQKPSTTTTLPRAELSASTDPQRWFALIATAPKIAGNCGEVNFAPYQTRGGNNRLAFFIEGGDEKKVGQRGLEPRAR